MSPSPNFLDVAFLGTNVMFPKEYPGSALPACATTSTRTGFDTDLNLACNESAR